MKITNKRSFIHGARKGFNYTGDTDDKQHLIDILRENFGIHSITSDRMKCVDGSSIIPDVETTDYDPKTYFELHGEYHEQINDTSDYTFRKRKKYEDLGLNLVEIWKTLTDGYEEKKVIEVLEANGIRKQ
jgi:hypothetical protein